MPRVDKALLEKYLAGACSPEEEAFLHAWFDLNDAPEYPRILRERTYRLKEQKIWKRLAANLEGLGSLSAKRRPRYLKFLRVAAAAAIIVLCVLTLEYYLNGALWSAGHNYSTTYGETKRISLADGTVVTLNAMSKLLVPRAYGKEARELYLEGEAYFQVRQDTALAFTVHSGDITTTALGTIFNIFAYPEQGKTVVSLREGKVAVKVPEESSLTLSPGEELIYSKGGRPVKKVFNERDRLSWRAQVIYFRDADLEEVIHKLERHYGVKFDYRSLEGQQWKLTGQYRQQSLKDVLESLSFNYGIRYEIHGNNVILEK